MGVTGPSRCPSCDEPLEPGDNFCGVCGADPLAAAPTPPTEEDPIDALPGGGRGRSYAPPPAGSPYSPPPPAAETRLPETEASAAPAPGGTSGGGGSDGADRAGRAGKRDKADDDYGLPAPPPTPLSPAPPASPTPPAPTATPPLPGGRSAADPRATTYEEHRTLALRAEVCASCRTGAIDKDGYCEHCGHARPRERDHMERELGGVAAVSDRGLRHHRNEDYFAVSATSLPDGSPAVVAVVCDGVSSATRPDDASRAAAGSAVEALLEALARGTHPQQAMHDAIVAAAKAVNSLAAEPDQPRRNDTYHRQNAPACTLVGAIVSGGLLTVGWVGDSRAYWVPDDRAGAARLTEDDSWAAQMVANGLMSEAEAYADARAHAITGWLGADAYELEPHTASFEPDRPGVVVVCTDGLWNYAESAAEMAATVPADARTRPLTGARSLVEHALAGGGHDNVTVALVPFLAPGFEPEPGPGPGHGPGVVLP